MDDLTHVLGAASIASAVLVFNFLFRFCVFLDARDRVLPRRPVRILPPLAWGLLILPASVPGLALYWAAHYSTLAKDQSH